MNGKVSTKMTGASTHEKTSEADPTSKDFDSGAALKFYETIPSLQDMASYAMAIELWRQFLSTQDPQRKPFHDNYDFEFFDYYDEVKVKKILDQFQLPCSIRKLVENCIDPVCTEIHNWATSYEKKILFSLEYITISDLMYCHWLPNGKIDRLKTASNMVSNPRMRPKDKYKIMCAYCLEDEIKQFPIDSLSEKFVKKIPHWNNNSLMYYWLCYLKNDMGKIKIENDESVESYYIKKSSAIETWSALDYFWDRLNVDDQTSVLEKLIVLYPKFQKNLFFKMNELQVIGLLSKVPIAIMKNFWQQPEQEPFALQTWLYIRNFLDNDQFKQLWKVLNTRDLSELDKKGRYLLEIWNHCPDYLKNLAFSTGIADIIFIKDSREPNLRRYPCGQIEFLSVYLSHVSAELRKSIIFERANVLVSVVDLSFTDQLIKLCLPDSEDILHFKQHVLESDFIQIRLCELLLGWGNHFERMNQFLEYFCPDPISRSEFCCKILKKFTEKHPEHFLIMNKNWFNVVDFIDKNLILTFPDRAFEFKKRIALWFNHNWYCWELLSNVDDMTKLTKFLTQVFDAKELDNFKSNALYNVMSYHWFSFDETFFVGFVSWCCNNDDQKVAELKKSLSVDEIFKKAFPSSKSDTFRHAVDEETMREKLKPLDRLLHWYFDNAEDMKWFKLRKVFGCFEEKPFKFLQDEDEDEDDAMPSDVFIKNVLPWFFDGQQSSIDFFKGINKNNRFGQMI